MDPDHNAKFAIHEAAREGNTSVVESLLNANPKLALLKDDDERLPIHWAVAYNRLPTVETLVANKYFDPDVVDGLGWTPLMIAASLKNAEGDPIIEVLLRRDADVNIKSVTGQNALHFAASKANLSTVRTLIAQNCSTRVKDRRGQLPLHRAAAVGSIPILKILLEKGNSPVNATDVDGLTALHHAISEGHGDAAIQLLKAGADPEKRDSNGNLAIDLAPDSKVGNLLLMAATSKEYCRELTRRMVQVRKYIIQTAEREGVELP